MTQQLLWLSRNRISLITVAQPWLVAWLECQSLRLQVFAPQATQPWLVALPQSRASFVLRSIVTAALLVLFVCPVYADLQVFASFEDPSEIAAVKGSAGVQLATSKRFPAWGGNSLDVSFPANGGSLEFTKIPTDWHRQESLLLFVWSVQPAELKLAIRDTTGSHFIQTFALRVGVNHLQLRLARVQGVDLRQVKSIELASARAGQFYFDYFALDRFHPVLAERGR